MMPTLIGKEAGKKKRKSSPKLKNKTRKKKGKAWTKLILMYRNRQQKKDERKANLLLKYNEKFKNNAAWIPYNNYQISS